jgi:hypothetical protein
MMVSGASKVCDMRSMKIPILLSLILMTPITACNLWGDELFGEAQQGVIFNSDTGKPVPDAFVVAMWTTSAGGIGHDGGSLCYHVESVITNAVGEYIIPTWKKKSTFRNIKKPRVLIIAYKPGYRWPLNGSGPWSALVESHDGPKERLDYLNDVVRSVICKQAGDSERNLLSLHKVIYKEVERVAVSPDEDKKVMWLLKRYEQIEYGYEEARKRSFERINRKND